MYFEQDFSFNTGKNCPRADITSGEQEGSSQVSSHSPKKEVPSEGPLALEPPKEPPLSQPGSSKPAELGTWRHPPSSKQPLSPGSTGAFQAPQECGEELVPGKVGARKTVCEGGVRRRQPPSLTGVEESCYVSLRAPTMGAPPVGTDGGSRPSNGCLSPPTLPAPQGPVLWLEEDSRDQELAAVLVSWPGPSIQTVLGPRMSSAPTAVDGKPVSSLI